MKAFVLLSTTLVWVTMQGGVLAAEGTAQTADEVKAALVGNTDCGANADGADTCIYFGTDGSLSGKSGTYTSKGTYEIKDDGAICLNWENRHCWKSNCTKRYPDASGGIEAKDSGGQVQFRVKQNLAGNAKNL